MRTIVAWQQRALGGSLYIFFCLSACVRVCVSLCENRCIDGVPAEYGGVRDRVAKASVSTWDVQFNVHARVHTHIGKLCVLPLRDARTHCNRERATRTAFLGTISA